MIMALKPKATGAGAKVSRDDMMVLSDSERRERARNLWASTWND